MMIILGVFVFIAAIIFGYLLTTGMVWLIVYAYNTIVLDDISVNVWALGLIVFLVSWMLKSIFSR